MADDHKSPEPRQAEGAKIPKVEEPNAYYNALLSIIAIAQELGACDEENLQAALQAEGIGEFWDYTKVLLEATEGEEFDKDESGADPASPEQENDADASEEGEQG